MKKYILSLDQGTTSSAAFLVDEEGKLVSSGRVAFKQYYPKPGWVQHDPEEIYTSQLRAAKEALEGFDPEKLAAVAITNQRETTVIWDSESGRAVYPAIVWQCRRTAGICEQLKKEGFEDYIKQTTGLVIDAYFSATKIKWILDRDPSLRSRAKEGKIKFGTVDSWLIYNLTGGKVHATDVTNASRTMLFDIKKLKWDEKILDKLQIPVAILPEVRDSGSYYGDMEIDGKKVPIMSVMGDQQASLFGQTCFKKGDIKNTYGTGCFLLCNTGETPVFSEEGLLTTLAWSFDGSPTYALEGSVFSAGSAIEWLIDGLGILEKASDSDKLASMAEDNAGLYMVPAFTGLGAPHWDMEARGTVIGLTRGSKKSHLVRAVLESIAFQSNDLIEIFRREADISDPRLRVDGGVSESRILMQFQADISDLPVVKSSCKESTALGTALMAGLKLGIWDDFDELKEIVGSEEVFYPKSNEKKREKLLTAWQKAVDTAIFAGSQDNDDND